MYHDQTTHPSNDMRWKMFPLLALGAFVTMIDKTAYDGRLDPVAYNRIGALLTVTRPPIGQPNAPSVGVRESDLRLQGE
jgi:hypothetical protein